MSKILEYLNSNISFIPSVIGYLIQDDKVLLGMRKKVASGMGVNLIAGIGGKLGDTDAIKDESPAEGLIREMREEIGVTPTQYTELGRVRFIWPDHLNWSQDVKIYTVQKWVGEPIETEVIKPIWFPINNLPLDQMWEDNAAWVPQSLAGYKVDMVFLIGNNNKTIEQLSF